jgi:rhamnogalacturonan acetylesterase
MVERTTATLMVWTGVAIAALLCWATGAHGQDRPPRQEAPPPPVNPALPTLWLIGDSTVRNGQDTGNNGQWGWGNPIAHFFDTAKINVQNRALGGTSSKTYRTIGPWDKVAALIKPGDYLIMQFGHNDAGRPDDPTRARATLRGNGEETVEIDNPITHKHEVVHTYGWYLRDYVAQAKAKGAAEVIICSPIPRNAWKDGKMVRNTGYGPVAAAAAKQAGADFINLNELAAEKYEAAGQEKTTATYFPENEVVHTDWAGAVLNATCVVEGIKALPDSGLAKYLRAEPPTDLDHPPMGKAR